MYVHIKIELLAYTYIYVYYNNILINKKLLTIH